MNAELISEFFEELNGNQLSSVEFVQDYLQLRFDGPCINAYTPLTVRNNGKSITSCNSGFRDFLCEQISKSVVNVSFELEKLLSIRFNDYSEINISLKPNDYSCPEAIYAHGFKKDGWLAL